ncbi:MAG: hypothetical protein MUC68_02555 [Burkholderiaceae bacterium]|jgi:hypothetical protein|nr:hypothetical protein [Burkholderiaceae bacterium]
MSSSSPVGPLAVETSSPATSSSSTASSSEAKTEKPAARRVRVWLRLWLVLSLLGSIGYSAFVAIDAYQRLPRGIKVSELARQQLQDPQCRKWETDTRVTVWRALPELREQNPDCAEVISLASSLDFQRQKAYLKLDLQSFLSYEQRRRSAAIREAVTIISLLAAGLFVASWLLVPLGWLGYRLGRWVYGWITAA